MELIRGATLEHILSTRGPFSAREAALIGIDLCRALAAIHAAGLIHRDVKAQNVMREDGGRIVLMDLGTGREIDRQAGSRPIGWRARRCTWRPRSSRGAPASGRRTSTASACCSTTSSRVRFRSAERSGELREGHKAGRRSAPRRPRRSADGVRSGRRPTCEPGRPLRDARRARGGSRAVSGPRPSRAGAGSSRRRGRRRTSPGARRRRSWLPTLVVAAVLWLGRRERTRCVTASVGPIDCGAAARESVGRPVAGVLRRRPDRRVDRNARRIRV